MEGLLALSTQCEHLLFFPFSQNDQCSILSSCHSIMLIKFKSDQCLPAQVTHMAGTQLWCDPLVELLPIISSVSCTVKGPVFLQLFTIRSDVSWSSQCSKSLCHKLVPMDLPYDKTPHSTDRAVLWLWASAFPQEALGPLSTPKIVQHPAKDPTWALP